MKQLLTLVFFLAIGTTVFGQKYFTKSGHIWFFSSAPLEDITAHNHQVTSVLDVEKNTIAFKVLMKSYQFKKSLMQDHFNESYVMSDEYPESTFKGKIVNIEGVDFSKNGAYKITVEGDLTIKDKTNKVKADGTLKVEGKTLLATSVFQIALEDYGVKIPSGMTQNIAEVLDINVDIKYELLNK